MRCDGGAADLLVEVYARSVDGTGARFAYGGIDATAGMISFSDGSVYHLNRSLLELLSGAGLALSTASRSASTAPTACSPSMTPTATSCWRCSRRRTKATRSRTRAGGGSGLLSPSDPRRGRPCAETDPGDRVARGAPPATAPAPAWGGVLSAARRRAGAGAGGAAGRALFLSLPRRCGGGGGGVKRRIAPVRSTPASASDRNTLV